MDSYPFYSSFFGEPKPALLYYVQKVKEDLKSCVIKEPRCRIRLRRYKPVGYVHGYLRYI
ncbi:hypothetical protein BS47DRAFT_289452 [Hydnum rufescens UP504]|uniref:Uncharacterized protein n=1 Tax=Hydnum rufescens UP504 TaxID=1448309 RepID=A0A9P6ALS1_9AGAM|nr:hypothetical protein BS47DRAFT_289452 [Hydnum rufescens UP504]